MASDWFNSRKAMLSLVAMFLEAVTAQAINTGCPVNCGSVPIPYPFGTEKGCYLSQDFKISCRSETPFLTRSHPQLEIKSISIDSHEMTVYTRMSESCYDQQGLINRSVIKTSFSSPSFPFSSTRNKFSAVGCDTLAFFEGDKFITGCFSYCYDSSSVDNSSCSGAGCCQNTNMTSGLHNYNISTSSPLEHHDSWEFNRCDYAFFGEDDSYVFQGMRDFQELGKRKNVPTVLDWAIRDHNCSMAKTHAASYACKGKYTTCMDSQNGAAYYCQCYPGFQGNPYIINGCQDNCKHQTCKSRVIKLASILSAVLLITIITGVIVLWRYVSKKRTEERRERYFRQNGGLVLQDSLSLLENAQNAFKVFRAEEMKDATNNFAEDRVVGRGGFGVVYKGYLSDGREDAIKKSKSVDKYEIDQFVNEVVLLSKIQHQNVVGFYGCCLETPQPLLVYEFITNGTLYDHLYNEDNNLVLPWETRLKIAVQTAGVLGYLHQDHRPQIIHSDIKPHNILLDENHNTKVSDLGISKLVPQNETELYTKVKGTMGYLDPEFIQSSQLTDKSDVYSFGVVLLEMLTGQRILSFDRPEKDRTLVMYFTYSVDEGSLLGILDRRIASQENVEELKAVAKIAGRCVSVKSEERPKMKEVAMELGSSWIHVNNRCNASGVDVEYISSGHPIGNAADGYTSSAYEPISDPDHILPQMLDSGR